MEEQKSIRIIFTNKADLILDGIIKNFQLEENVDEFAKRLSQGKLSKNVIISNLSKDFAKGILSEKDLINSLQKDLEISSTTAEQISKEIINKLIPLLEKVPEEKLTDPVSREEVSKRIFGEEIKQNPASVPEKNEKILKPEKNPIFAKEPIITEKPIKKPKKTAVEEFDEPEKISKLPKKIIQTERPKSSGSDSYREPIG